MFRDDDHKYPDLNDFIEDVDMDGICIDKQASGKLPCEYTGVGQDVDQIKFQLVGPTSRIFRK